MESITTIKFKDFEKMELRVAEIQKIEDIEGEVQGLDKNGNPKTFKQVADKLYKLEINLGEKTRTICAGIKQFYSHDDLKGKRIIVLTNLESRKIRGVESQGMLLAASNEDHTKLSLISPDKDIEVGSLVG